MVHYVCACVYNTGLVPTAYGQVAATVEQLPRIAEQLMLNEELVTRFGQTFNGEVQYTLERLVQSILRWHKTHVPGLIERRNRNRRAEILRRRALIDQAKARHMQEKQAEADKHAMEAAKQRQMALDRLKEMKEKEPGQWVAPDESGFESDKLYRGLVTPTIPI